MGQYDTKNTSSKFYGIFVKLIQTQLFSFSLNNSF